jgi:hypothetical protein
MKAAIFVAKISKSPTDYVSRDSEFGMDSA